MRKLSALEIKAVIDFDREFNAPWSNRNRTRFYKFLTVNGVDIEVRTVACRYGKGHFAIRPTLAKEVARASVDSSRMFVRDVAHHVMSGYVVDWSREGLAKAPDWSADGWFGIGYSATDHKWKIRNYTVVNPGELATVERFKYCSWTPDCGDILDYLKVYASHPRVELLVKSGLSWLSCRSSFVARLEKNKDFMRFVMANIEDLKLCGYGVDVLNLAYCRGCSLHEANKRIADRREFKGMRLPAEVDASKALAYLKAQKGVYKWGYSDYLRDCKAIGLTLEDTKVCFPRNFKARMEEVSARKEELERRKDAQKKRDMDKRIAERAITLARLEAVCGYFAVVLPKKEADLKKEGKRLKHCVGNGSYAEKIASGALVIAFIRRKKSKDTPFATVSFDTQTRKVAQCYGLKNSKPEKRVMDFINGPFERSARRIIKAI